MTSLPAARPFFGWRVVAATFLLAVFGWGVGFYGPPVYLHAVVARTGWPVTLVSTAVTVHFLFGALVVANLPRLHRAFGVPRVTVLGAALLAAGVAGWAVAAEPWQLFAAALASGGGWVALGAAAVNAIVAPWFVRNRPAALGMAYNGASVGGILFSPLWVALIGGLGFPAASVAVGLAMTLVVGLLSALVFAKTPESLGQQPDGDRPGKVDARPTPRHAEPLAGGGPWRDRRFITLAAAMALGLFAQIGLLAHLFSLLVPALGEGGAGLTMAAATLAAIAGRSLVGWLMPVSADRRLVACASLGVQVLGSLILAVAAMTVDGGAGLLAGILLFGLGIGNATSLPPLIAQAEFRADDAARVVPLIVAIGQAAYAFAPAAFGLLRAGPGAEPQAGLPLFLAAALVQAAAIAAFLWGRRSRRPAVGDNI
ncbi:MFS transporter [Azospirillum agricola]|uniref:MFS transporter n=1 Tax=Azospirillum agricola TaxID=1720247 RepID=UPI000A0F21AE|nr:MFS transporter [Azospirillum agricola]SMH29866.1 Cyanate permease [Azospirillum lipoferum]